MPLHQSVAPLHRSDPLSLSLVSGHVRMNQERKRERESEREGEWGEMEGLGGVGDLKSTVTGLFQKSVDKIQG